MMKLLAQNFLRYCGIALPAAWHANRAIRPGSRDAASQLLVERKIARVAADPARVPEAGQARRLVRTFISSFTRRAENILFRISGGNADLRGANAQRRAAKRAVVHFR